MRSENFFMWLYRAMTPTLVLFLAGAINGSLGCSSDDVQQEVQARTCEAVESIPDEELYRIFSQAVVELEKLGVVFDRDVWRNPEKFQKLILQLDRLTGCNSLQQINPLSDLQSRQEPLKNSATVDYCGPGLGSGHGGTNFTVDGDLNYLCYLHDSCYTRCVPDNPCTWSKTTKPCDEPFIIAANGLIFDENKFRSKFVRWVANQLYEQDFFNGDAECNLVDACPKDGDFGSGPCWANSEESVCYECLQQRDPGLKCKHDSCGTGAAELSELNDMYCYTANCAISPCFSPPIAVEPGMGGASGSGGNSTGGAGGSSGSGTAGTGGTPAICNAFNCNGCCNDNVCIATAKQSNLACGSKGESCLPCGSGKFCSSGSCVDNNKCSPTSCPNGCCDGNFCVNKSTQDWYSCGGSGEACNVCEKGTLCTTSGICDASKFSPNAVLRLTYGVVQVPSTDPNGDAWDVLGGLPDPKVCLLFGGKPFCTANCEDTLACDYAPYYIDNVVPEHLTNGDLQIQVLDVDAAFDDPMTTWTVKLSYPLSKKTKYIVTSPSGNYSFTFALDVIDP